MKNGNSGDGNPWSRNQQALMDEGMKTMTRMMRLPGLYERAQRVKKGVTPSEVVFEVDKMKLLHYTSEKPPIHKTPLIFVFALVNRPYILDLHDQKSVVQKFVNAGFDTYLIDWGTPDHSDRHLGLEHYVDGYIPRVVNYVQKVSDVDKVNILGYCMGGTMSAMYTALNPDSVKNLILLAAGINFDTDDSLLNEWAKPENFNVDDFVDAYGNCPADFLQGGFSLLKPIQNFIQKPLNFYENLDNDKFIDEFLTMESWLNENIPLPGNVYRQFIKNLYQKNLLVQGRMPIGDRIVNLGDIHCPILNLMASNDDLVPCAQSEPFNDLVSSTDRKTMKLKAGHIGLAVGSRAHKEFWPSACDWLAERSEA